MRAAGVAAIVAVAGLAAACALDGPASRRALGDVPGLVPLLRLTIGLTPLAAPFCALLAVLDLAVALWCCRRGRAVDAGLIAGFSAAMLLVVLARSVAAFFAAWEAMALCSVFLVLAHPERRGVRRAAVTYLAVSQAGALCVLVALLLLAAAAGDGAFAALARNAATLPAGTRAAVLALALVGFGSKAGLMPLHFWLPRAHPVAPAHASALLSGAMLNVALYGLALIAFELAAPAPTAWGLALVAVGTISAVGGVLYALVDRDLKRLLAYSSIENVGIVTIALGVAVVAAAAGAVPLAGLALTAGLFHAFNHGLFKALLFLGAGAVGDAAGTVDLERLGGAWALLPWTAPTFLLGCAAIVGLPPLNGFASEWLTFAALVGMLRAGDSTIALAAAAAVAGLALTGGLAVACFVKAFGVVFLGRARSPRPPHPVERPDLATAALLLLTGACVLLGVAPVLATAPLAAAAVALFGGAPAPLAPLPLLPAVALLPLAGAGLAAALAAARGVRRVPTWSCGSPVGPATQYTATAFSKPLRTIFAFVLVPDRSRRTEGGASPWFPQRIVYRTASRYLVDETARRGAAGLLRFARRSRIVQSGNLRLYFAYALATVVIVALAAR